IAPIGDSRRRSYRHNHLLKTALEGRKRMQNRPSQAAALTFDCYGTLIDWERGILETLRPWAHRAGAPVSDEELLARFAEAESEAEEENPGAIYSDILEDVQHRLAETIGAPATDAD